ETARARAELHQSGRLLSGGRNFRSANVGLMVRHAQMLGPELGRDGHGLTRRQGIVEHRLIQAFRMQIELYFSSARGHTFEHGLPKIVAALFDAALAMSANRHHANRRATLEQQAQRVAAVSSMRLARQALNAVVGLWTVDPFIAMHPNA